MLQIDVFWSFAWGAMFAALAHSTLVEHYKSLRAQEKVKSRLTLEEIFVNKIFVQLMIFMSFVFVPSGLYLLWGYPAWESMIWLKDRDSTHPVVPTLFAFINAFMGTLGFYVTARLIESTPSSESEKVHFYWISAYGIFNAILGMGYNRFIFAGSYGDWVAGRMNTLNEFLQSDVLNTLLTMATFFVPIAFTLLIGHLRKTYATFGNGYKSKFRVYILKQGIWQYLAISTAWLGYVFVILKEDERKTLDDGTWAGIFGPLVWFTFTQVFVFSIILIISSIPVPRLRQTCPAKVASDE